MGQARRVLSTDSAVTAETVQLETECWDEILEISTQVADDVRTYVTFNQNVSWSFGQWQVAKGEGGKKGLFMCHTWHHTKCAQYSCRCGNKDWVFVNRVPRRILDLWERKWQDLGGDSVMNLYYCQVGGACSTHGSEKRKKTWSMEIPLKIWA